VPVEVSFTGYQHQGRALRVQSAREVTDPHAAEERSRALEERLHVTRQAAATAGRDLAALLGGISRHAASLESVAAGLPNAGTEIGNILEAAARALKIAHQLGENGGRNGSPVVELPAARRNGQPPRQGNGTPPEE
jgi:hypothetical protein